MPQLMQWTNPQCEVSFLHCNSLFKTFFFSSICMHIAKATAKKKATVFIAKHFCFLIASSTFFVHIHVLSDGCWVTESSNRPAKVSYLQKWPVALVQGCLEFQASLVMFSREPRGQRCFLGPTQKWKSRFYSFSSAWSPQNWASADSLLEVWLRAPNFPHQSCSVPGRRRNSPLEHRALCIDHLRHSVLCRCRGMAAPPSSCCPRQLLLWNWA